jgi:hypothetical protein
VQGSCTYVNCLGSLWECEHCICTDINEDPNHCGQCGNACAAGQSCQDGQCV